jgi:hypothetical protein
MIVGKSNHPVEIKRIELSIWSLRDEVEKAVELRLEETSEGNEPVLDDIKEFYNRNPNFMTQDIDFDEDDDDDEIEAEDSNVDSSGNEMDDDAMAMAAALEGGDEAEADGEADDSEASEEQSEDEEVSAEVADIAAQMLADQGIQPNQSKVNYTRPQVEESKVVKAFTILSDINMFYALIFSDKPFIKGQTIVIKLNVPNSFSVTAEVINVKHLTRNSRIISKSKPNYRVQARIAYLFDGERAKLREFLTSVEPEIPPPPKKMKKIEDDKEDDDFEDLGF